VQAVEPTDQTIWVCLEEFKIGFQDLSEFIELSLSNSFQHKSAITCVVKKTSGIACAGAAQI
jgi:hypothetical protein